MQKEIKRKRLEANLTQKELAEILGVCKQTVCEWEKGRSVPRHKTLVKLTNALNTTAEELFAEVADNISKDIVPQYD